jgi:shikimate kinase
MKLPSSFSRLFLLGMPGAGKTSVGELLSEKWHVPFIDMDLEITREAGMSIAEIFQRQGEETFREMEKSVLHQLGKTYTGIISTGGGAPCFFDNMDYMNKTGLTVFIHPGHEVLESRLQKPSGRPMFDKESSPGDKLKELWKVRRPFYMKAKLIVESSENEKIIRRIENYIQSA